MTSNNRVALYSKLTNAEDGSCTLFEDLLNNFFEEYGHLYTAIQSTGNIDEIVDISCTEFCEAVLKINISFSKKILDLSSVSSSILEYLEKKTHNKYIITSKKSNKKNTILITIIKDGDLDG